MIHEYEVLLENLVSLRKFRIKVLKEISIHMKDLSVTDLLIFRKVCAASGRLTMSELSDQTGFSNAIITSSVDSLEGKGLVYREKGEDRRSYYICTTDEGNDRYRQIKSDERNVLESIFSNMKEEDLERLFSIMSELREIIEKYS